LLDYGDFNGWLTPEELQEYNYIADKYRELVHNNPYDT
jgi:hypothetical protein